MVAVSGAGPGSRPGRSGAWDISPMVTRSILTAGAPYREASGGFGRRAQGQGKVSKGAALGVHPGLRDHGKQVPETSNGCRYHLKRAASLH